MLINNENNLFLGRKFLHFAGQFKIGLSPQKNSLEYSGLLLYKKGSNNDPLSLGWNLIAGHVLGPDPARSDVPLPALTLGTDATGVMHFSLFTPQF